MNLRHQFLENLSSTFPDSLFKENLLDLPQRNQVKDSLRIIFIRHLCEKKSLGIIIYLLVYHRPSVF